MTTAINAESVSLGYRRWRHDRPLSIQGVVQRGFRGNRSRDLTWALREVSFTVGSGTSLGVVGSNGAGKSTLLRIIGGVLEPDEGTMVVNGKVGAILELGAGFHPDLTGRENIFINGVIAGLTLQEVRERFDEIVAFSELRDFLDTPLRAYSNGMKMRLGFSIAVHVDAQLLLIDEILAVGDLTFRKKCFGRLEYFRDSGRTIVLVSHDAQTVRRMCDQVLWIDGGRVRAFGPATGVLEAYVANSETQPSPAQ